MGEGRLLHLTELSPTVTAAEMVKDLVPPRQFDGAQFATYRPDPEYPSQAAAVEAGNASPG